MCGNTVNKKTYSLVNIRGQLGVIVDDVVADRSHSSLVHELGHKVEVVSLRSRDSGVHNSSRIRVHQVGTHPLEHTHVHLQACKFFDFQKGDE